VEVNWPSNCSKRLNLSPQEGILCFEKESPVFIQNKLRTLFDIYWWERFMGSFFIVDLSEFIKELLLVEEIGCDLPTRFSL